jgi:hypothetical protein
MKPTLSSAIAAFGAKAKEKLANPAASGQPEDHLRTPFEHLLGELSEISDFGKAAVSAVGESSVSDLKTRPDFAVTVHNALVGFVELKAPGKGADPRKFKDPARQTSVGKIQFATEYHLHRRQRLQPLAKWAIGRLHRHPDRRHRIFRQQAAGAARIPGSL